MKWSKSRLKQEVQVLYQMPEPVGKKDFLQQMKRERSVSIGAFLWEQFWYIKKSVWIITLTVVLLGGYFDSGLKENTVTLLAVLSPFLAFTVLIESGKSQRYGMAELEQATRFSLKSVLLARMGVLGIIHTVILSIVIVISQHNEWILLRHLYYILVPYFVTVYLGIYCTRKFRGRETNYLYVCIPVLVSFVTGYSKMVLPVLYQADKQMWWLILLVAAIILAGREVYLLCIQKEDVAWN